MQQNKVLFIATSNNKIPGSVYKTGLWLETLAVPYYLFKETGIEVTIASPDGRSIPIDPKSQSIIVATRTTKRFLLDNDAKEFLSSSLPLEEVSADQFDAVFITGGHGALWDMADNSVLNQVMQDFLFQSKPIAVLAQGVVCLLTLLNDSGGLWIEGKKITSCSNGEEKATGLAAIVPFLLESKLISLGTVYSKGSDYSSHVVTDGNVITGQNPASAETAANKMLSLLRNNRPVSLADRQLMPTRSSSL